MPAARTDQQRGGLVVQRYSTAVRIRAKVIVRRTASVRFCCPSTTLCPGRRERIFEVGHEDVRAGVERVDHHLAVGRTGDLRTAVLQVGRGRSNLPLSLTHVTCALKEAKLGAGVQFALPFHSRSQ